MLDESTPKGRIASAALRLAAQKPWTDVTLLDIAEAANVPLNELRDAFKTKSDILAALVRSIDDEVLKNAPKRSDDQDRRDALFDIIMSRFDLLDPHKAALKSIHAAGSADPALARAILASQHWMLQAAGIGTDGPGGRLRVGGLAMVYASVFRTWLEDDDPGLARTMAALDRRLRRGERTVRNAEQIGSVLYRFATDTPGFIRSVMRGRRKRDPRPQPNPEPSPGAEPGTV
jgi:ubiquinone biosynthesis protein COQ9